MSRLKLLRDLVEFRKPIDVLTKNLSCFDWDYDGQPLKITSADVINILERFLAGNYTAIELEGWANLIECREDLSFDECSFDEIENVIHSLANPSLQGAITFDSCTDLLQTVS